MPAATAALQAAGGGEVLARISRIRTRILKAPQ